MEPGCIGDNTAVEFLDGALPAHAVQAVEAHAAGCGECRQLLAELARGLSRPAEALSPTMPAAGAAHVRLEQGQQVGRFIVLGRLGSGGMGVVFSAYDPKLDRKVALKLLRGSPDEHQSAAEAQARLLREAQAMAQLAHPNVIAVFDVGTYDSEVYIAMELVEGDTLGRWLKAWERPLPDIIDKFAQAGRALAAAHAAGLLHRDFKPDNVLVGADGRVRVMDFGLARSLFTDVAPAEPGQRLRLDSALDHPLTRSGMLLGTPRYMAPEQLAGRTADARSDQFSFCVALFEAACGGYPFERGLAIDLVEGGSEAALLPMPPHVPAWLQRVLTRGLSAEPSRRYPAMTTLLEDLVPPRRPARSWMPAALGLAAATILASALLMRPRGSEALTPPTDRIGEVEDYKRRLQEAQETIGSLQEDVAALQGELEQVRTHDRARIAELLQKIEAGEQRIGELLRETRRLRTQLADTPPAAGRPARTRGLSPVEIAPLVQRRLPDIGDCVGEWRERMPAADGVLGVVLEIGPTGAVRSARSTGVGDRVVDECIAGLVRSVEYPTSDGISVVQVAVHSRGDEVRLEVEVVDRRPPEPTPRGGPTVLRPGLE